LTFWKKDFPDIGDTGNNNNPDALPQNKYQAQTPAPLPKDNLLSITTLVKKIYHTDSAKT